MTNERSTTIASVVRRTGRGLLAGIVPILLLGSTPGEPRAQERAPSTAETQGRQETTAERSVELDAPHGREPLPSPFAERMAIEAGREQGAPVSRALADTVARQKALPAPEGEVFALIKITDRKTGERRVFARGVPDAKFGRYLEDPSSAPSGQIWAETDQGFIEGDFEIAIRSITMTRGADPVKSPSADEEEEIDLIERNADGAPLSHRIDGDLRAMILDGRIGLEDREGDTRVAPIPVIVTPRNVPPLSLPKAADPAQGGLLWAALDVQAERQRRLIERKQAMARLQRPLIEAIEHLGGRVEYATWGGGAIQAELPPSAIEKLARHPDLFSIEYLSPPHADAHRYMGDDLYVATNAENYSAHAGNHGTSSKHSYTSRVVVAMSEECVDMTSPAWRTGGPGSAMRGAFYDIDPNSGVTLGGVETCWASTAHSTTGHASHKHGHWVLGNMTGDFMDGQEPVLSASERRQRTGSCEECFFLFGQDWNLNERGRAHDWACDLGADIFQSSISSGSSCDGNGGFDSDVQALAACDVVYVQSAGNNGSTGGCTTSHPADHPWTFSVGGMDTEEPCDTAGEYYTTTCDYDTSASKGGTTYDSCGGCADINDLTGPYRVCHGLAPGTANPTDRDCIQGTSFASPIVAGLMARVMDWYRQHISTSIFYDNRARNFMLLMGDRSANASGAGQWTNTTDPRWGAGRVRLEPFDNLAYWNVYRGSATLGAGQSYTFSYSMGSSAQFFKAAVWHTGKDYSNEPMIRLTLNPTGCSTATAAVDRLDAKTILAMILNGCTGMNATVKNVKVGTSGSRRFHFAAYGKSGTSDRGF